MLINRVDTFEGLLSLRAAWDEVYRGDPEAQFFLSWMWLAGALEGYPGKWMVLAARDLDGAYLGFLPLRLKTVWSKSRQQLRNEIAFAGRLFWADYGGILCLPEHEEEVLRGLASHLKRMNWSRFYMRGFRISDRRFRYFMESFKDDQLLIESLPSTMNEGKTDNLICPYIELPSSFEAYLGERLSKKKRQELHRALRKFDSSSEYRITLTTAASHSRDVQILEALWRNMWGWEKGSSTAIFAAKYGKIVRRGLHDGTILMPILWRGDDPVGVLASFVDLEKSHLLFFVTGRDKSFRDLPVGLVLHAYNIRWAIENGIRIYDFLQGNEPYKYSLGSVDLTLKYPLVRTRSGINLNGKLDPGCIGEALRLADEFVRQKSIGEVTIICEQALATLAGRSAAERLMKTLAEFSEI